MNEKNFFWEKKVFVTYILSIFIFLRHASSFNNYSQEGSWIADLNGIFHHLMTDLTGYRVSLFFIISGALFFRNYSHSEFLRKLKKRVRTLLVPYLSWNIIWTVFAIVTSYSFISSYFVGRPKFELSLMNVLEGVFHYGENIPFWFMFELMFFVLLSPLFNVLSKNKTISLITCLALIGLCHFNIGLPYPLFHSQTSIISYFIGVVIGKYYFDKFMATSSSPTRIVSICILVAYAFLYFDNEPFPEVLDNLVKIVAGLAFWNCMDYIMPLLKERERYHNSFFIFAMHINVSAIITKLLYLALPKSDYLAIPNFILTVILTLCFINVFNNVLKKHFRKLNTLLSGAR